MSETNTTELKPMFVFDIKHKELSNSSSIWKVAHTECFENNYSLPANYTARVERTCDTPRSRCEFCGEQYNPVEAKREEDALRKWLESGDRTDYTLIKNAQNKQAKVTAPKYKQLGAETGRFSSKHPNISSPPQTGIKASGIKSGGATIVTHQEQALSDMSKLTDEELFGKK